MAGAHLVETATEPSREQPAELARPTMALELTETALRQHRRMVGVRPAVAFSKTQSARQTHHGLREHLLVLTSTAVPVVAPQALSQHLAVMVRQVDLVVVLEVPATAVALGEVSLLVEQVEALVEL